LNKKIHIRVRPEDRARLEMIRETMGVSMNAAVRAAIVLLCKQLGFEKEGPR
jgi:predicted HicB family RNase H-like nuclease